MKKLVSFVMAAVLCMGMATTVMAAGSPAPEVTVETEVSNPDVTVTVTTNVGWTPEEVMAETGAPAALQVAYLEVDHVDGADATGVVSFKVHGATVGDTWVAYAWNSTTNAWDAMRTEVTQGGVVTVNFSHFCEVLLVKIAAAPVAGGNNVATSPKTADAGLMLAGLAVMAATGTAVASRKAKASK